MDKNKLKGYCLVAAFAVAFYLGLSNLERLGKIFSAAMGLLTPFLIGLVIAFILNSPLTFFEKKVFGGVLQKRPKAVRPLSLVCTYLSVAAGVTVLFWFVAPQLMESVARLSNSIPAFLASLQKWIGETAGALQFTDAMWSRFLSWFEDFMGSLLGMLPKILGMLPQVYNIVVGVGGGLFNILVGIVVSIYLLISKETLVNQMTRLNRAFLPGRAANWLEHAGHITVRTFRNYISGQVTDAVIVGVLCVVILSLGGFPYAMLIGVVMGCTNVIPFFGPFIGFVPGFLILVMVNPVRALVYTVIVVVVQQIDGNFIVPKVVGNSVGLPPLWVLFSVSVGGGLFGVAGMVIGMPAFAVIYQLLGEATRARETAPPPRVSE